MELLETEIDKPAANIQISNEITKSDENRQINE